MPNPKLQSKTRLSTGEGFRKKVVKSCTINRRAEELFHFWRRLENLPQFAQHLVSVTQTSDKESHWVAKSPAGTQEWDAEIINEHENHLIAWQTKPGSVRFEPAPAGQGTEVRVSLEYIPPAGRLGAALAKLYGEEPELQIEDDLARFKALMEVGEIPTTEGQPVGAGQAQKGSAK